MKIAFVGAGNVATSLSQDLESKGNTIVQICSLNASSASSLARIVHCGFTTDLKELVSDADFYFICVKDDIIEDIVSQMPRLNGIVVHTSGSTSIDVLKNKFSRCGVFYPLQSFSKFKKVTLKSSPVFVEGSELSTGQKIMSLAGQVSEHVHAINSQQRLALHICGVFASSFVNHMYALAFVMSKKYDLPFEVFFPLIEETAGKIKQRSPLTAQAGPAVRKDMKILAKHEDFLKSDYLVQKIYKLISESIIKLSDNKQQ